ncbi:MAG TPA: phage portal protein, partial [Reyranella sp.]
MVDTTTDRIELQGASGPDEATTAELTTIIQEAELLLEADDAHQSAIIGGEAYIIAWKDPDTDELECYFNDPRMCHVFYEAERPNVPRLAAKWWDGDDGWRHLKLYTADEIAEFRVPMKKEDGKFQMTLLEQVSRDANPHGKLPVFHFRSHRRHAASDLSNILPIQDGINILLINMMVTAEFSAAPMKYVISNAEGIEDLVVAPNRIWNIPSGDGLPGSQGTQVGQFPASDLNNYLVAIAHGIDAISAISRTPRHYFYGSQLPPSGESLKTMEGPLVKKVKDRIARFAPTWRRLLAFLYQLKTGKEIDPNTIVLIWADPETMQPQQAAATEAAKAGAIAAKLPLGVSSQQGLRELGYDDKKIGQMQEERAAWATYDVENLESARLALETVRAQLGLVLAQAALARGQIGVTPRVLLTELGYSDEEITKMMGDAADAPLPPPDGKGGGSSAKGAPDPAAAMQK